MPTTHANRKVSLRASAVLALASIAMLAVGAVTGCAGGVPLKAAEDYHDSVGRNHRAWLMELRPDGSLPADPARALNADEILIRVETIDDFGRLLDGVREAQGAGARGVLDGLGEGGVE